MVSNFTESMRSNFSQIRDLQAYFNETIVNLCSATVERIMKGELEDEFPDDTREVNLLSLSQLLLHHHRCFFLESSYLLIKIRS